MRCASPRPGGTKTGSAQAANNCTTCPRRAAVAMLEQLKNATGIDIEKIAQGSTRDTSAQVPKELG